MTSAWQGIPIPGRNVWFQAYPEMSSFDPGVEANFWAHGTSGYQRAMQFNRSPTGARVRFWQTATWYDLEYRGGPPHVYNPTGGVLLPFTVPLPWP